MQIRSILCVAVLFGVAGWSPSVSADAAGGSDPVAAPAPEPVPSAGPDPSGGILDTTPDDSTPWGGGDTTTLKLSLAEAIALGLENNLGIQVQRFDPLISEEDMEIAWGAYDPIWESDVGWDEQRSPSASQFDLSNTLSVQKTLSGKGGFVGLLPLLSTQYSAKLASDRTTTNFPFASLSPEYTTTVSFSLTQPLLRGLVWNEPWTRVKISKIAYTSSLEAFRLDLMNIVTGIEDAYWFLIADHENMIVAQKSLETSQALLEQTRTQYDVGVISRVEVIQAEAGVADREFKLIVAENVYHASQDRLITLVLGEQLRPETTLAIEPTDRAGDYVTYDIDVAEATNVAFAHRPEIVLADQAIERLEIAEKFAVNQRLPQFDLQGIYAYRGLSGKQNPDLGSIGGTPTPIPPTDYGDSYDDFFDPDGANNWAFRGFFSIPIPNTSARHRVTQSRIELRQARTQKRRVELDIILQIRTAARDLEASQEGIEAAERGVAAAAEQLRAEEIRLEYGESTPYDVLLREEDLVQAESQKIGAFRAFRRSLTALDRQQGTILRNRNIAIDDLLTLR
jgi:outer membrane protein